MAGVLVYGWTGPAAWIHAAGDGQWLTRGFARAVFGYVFRDMGCARLLACAEVVQREIASLHASPRLHAGRQPGRRRS